MCGVFDGYDVVEFVVVLESGGVLCYLLGLVSVGDVVVDWWFGVG